MSVSFKYGDYDFVPRPLFGISARPIKDPDGVGHGIEHTISVEGDLILMDSAITSGAVGVFEKIEQLKDALDHDGKLLAIECSGSAIISGYPLIESYNIERTNDNYTRRATYTIEFVMPTTVLGTGSDVFNSSVIPPYIESCEEQWDMDFQDERMPFEWQLADGTDEKFGYKLAVTHTVNVQARLAYTGSTYPNTPWEDAKAYATGKLGFDSDFVTLTGVLGLPGGAYFSTFDVFNQYRQVGINKTAGSIQVTETFIVSPSGSGGLPNNAIETFDISTSQSDGIVTVGIQGEIEGLCNISYDASTTGMYVTASKYNSASGYYTLIKDRLFDRARTAYSGVADSCYNRNLNPIIRNRTVGINPIAGRITYDYQYDTTPSACLTGECLLSQSISIDDQLATDVFAPQVIPGRASGPILQDINTPTVRVRTINVELVTLPPVSCSTVAEMYAPVPTGEVDAFIAIVSGDLSSTYNQVFISSHAQNWNLSVGRYTKSVGLTYTNCSGL
jgi:hypothetical protein